MVQDRNFCKKSYPGTFKTGTGHKLFKMPYEVDGATIFLTAFKLNQNFYYKKKSLNLVDQEYTTDILSL